MCSHTSLWGVPGVGWGGVGIEWGSSPTLSGPVGAHAKAAATLRRARQPKRRGHTQQQRRGRGAQGESLAKRTTGCPHIPVLSLIKRTSRTPSNRLAPCAIMTISSERSTARHWKHADQENMRSNKEYSLPNTIGIVHLLFLHGHPTAAAAAVAIVCCQMHHTVLPGFSSAAGPRAMDMPSEEVDDAHG